MFTIIDTNITAQTIEVFDRLADAYAAWADRREAYRPELRDRVRLVRLTDVTADLFRDVRITA